MKYLAFVLGFSFLSIASLSAVESAPAKACACTNCNCTIDNHCGCMSDKGCSCGELQNCPGGGCPCDKKRKKG